MSAPLAIGVGCRKNVAAVAIVALVAKARAMLEGRPDGPARLYTIDQKRNEPGLHEAATRLGLDLVFLPKQVLQTAMARVVTPSAAAEQRFGVASVSEAAALAGAGPSGTLLVQRMARDGVTVAIAIESKAQT